MNDLDILEFNLQYFESITDDNERDAVLVTYPVLVQQAYRIWSKKKTLDPWVEIPAAAGGICFGYGDKTPLLIAAIPSLYKMEEAVDREGRRDENELYKLLIQKMPIDNKGELVFELEEVADIHESVATMLQDRDTIDVLTTFGDTSLESLQDSTAASQSSDRIEKYKTSAFDSLGRSSILFNSDGSNSLAYSIQRDEALMISISEIYANWIKYQINLKFARPNLTFDFTILPTTIFDTDDYLDRQLKLAQVSVPNKGRLLAADGINTAKFLGNSLLENTILGDIFDSWKPLATSFTQSGSSDVTDKGGRPEVSNATNENTIISKSNNSNSTPSPNG
jgi:hypothetical protein